MNKKKFFVFLESNTTGTGELLIQKALDRGMQLLFLTKTHEKYPFLKSHAVSVISVDTTDKKAICDVLKLYEPVIGIYSTSEYYIEMASIVAQHFGLPGNTPEAIAICRNKYKLYQEINVVGIDMARTSAISNYAEADLILESHDLPVVVKPISGSGSVGVKYCETKDVYLAHVKVLFDAAVVAQSPPEEPCVLVQDYISGKEFSVEVCSLGDRHHIIGVTQKHLAPLPFFIESGHDFPAMLSSDELERIELCIVKLLDGLKFTFGYSHIELRIKEGVPFIIEVNPRLAGGMIPVLIEKATGIDLLNNLLDLYIGRSVSFSPSKHNFASIRHVIPQKSGKIKMCFINSESNELAEEVKLNKKAGDTFLVSGDYRDRVAYVISSGASLLESQKKAEMAIKNIQFEIED